MADDLEAVDGGEEKCGELHSVPGLEAVHGEEEKGGGLPATAGVLQDVHGEEEMAPQTPAGHAVQYPTPQALQEPVVNGLDPLEPHAQAKVERTPASRAENKQAEGLDSPSQQVECPWPNLPEDIWCHIHSLMPVQDAARVACVSWAFACFWRCHPNLAFTDETLGLKGNPRVKDDKMRDFTSIIDHILKNHSGIGVKTFKLQVGIVYRDKDYCLLDHLDSWLQIAVKPGIEEMILSLSSVNGTYNFPCSLLSGGTGDSLRYLSLASRNFHPPVRCGCLRSLTRLHLCMVHIKDQELGCFLANSFALEWLEIRYCSAIICLKIPFLQRLSFLKVEYCDRLQVIESKAPNLSSFFFVGDLHVQLSLGDTSQIRKLTRFCNDAAFYARTELPSSMPNLETLIIYSDKEVVNTPMVTSKFFHLKFLDIILWFPFLMLRLPWRLSS